jgi:hypothetical protein
MLSCDGAIRAASRILSMWGDREGAFVGSGTLGRLNAVGAHRKVSYRLDRGIVTQL